MRQLRFKFGNEVTRTGIIEMKKLPKPLRPAAEELARGYFGIRIKFENDAWWLYRFPAGVRKSYRGDVNRERVKIGINPQK